MHRHTLRCIQKANCFYRENTTMQSALHFCTSHNNIISAAYNSISVTNTNGDVVVICIFTHTDGCKRHLGHRVYETHGDLLTNFVEEYILLLI